MNESWIVEVLADLRRFTRLNGHDRLADEIARTEAVARHEIARRNAAPATTPPQGPPPGQ